MKFLDFEEVKPYFAGKSVAIVGSGPGVVENPPGHVTARDVVVRVNNYKLGHGAGYRTDVHYSFYGNSVRKTRDELIADGVQLCMCKCPDSQPIESDWHRANNKLNGIDFTYIYRARQGWWPCDTFIPTDEHFLRYMQVLEGHIPTTGFSAILDVLECEPASVYLTGFDFFQSGLHNVDEKWRPGDATDPIGHRPDLEAAWLRNYLEQRGPGSVNYIPIEMDAGLRDALPV